MSSKTSTTDQNEKPKKSGSSHSRKTKGEAFWRRHLGAWKRSGVSKAAYCRRHGLCANTMSTWGTRLNKTEKTQSPPAFVQVIQPEPAPASRDGLDILQIRFPNGCTVDVPTAVSPSTIRPWLEELARLG